MCTYQPQEAAAPRAPLCCAPWLPLLFREGEGEREREGAEEKGGGSDSEKIRVSVLQRKGTPRCNSLPHPLLALFSLSLSLSGPQLRRAQPQDSGGRSVAKARRKGDTGIVGGSEGWSTIGRAMRRRLQASAQPKACSSSSTDTAQPHTAGHRGLLWFLPSLSRAPRIGVFGSQT